MSPFVCLSLIVYTCIYFHDTEGEWVSPPDLYLPHEDYTMSIGAFNDIITIIGGNHNPLDLTTYNISSHIITGFGRILPTFTRGYSQYWTQMGHIVLLLDVYSSVINSYDLSTKIFTQKWRAISIPNNVSIYTGCIASTQHALFIIGGADEVNDIYFDTFFIYNLNNSIWHNGASISPARSRHSCIVNEVSDTLYVIGGHDHYNAIHKIQYMAVNNAAHNAWNVLYHNLEFRCNGIRSVSYDKYIYIISGSEGDYLNTVHIIDTETNNLSVAQHSLLYGVSYSTPVVVNGRLYVFGGRIRFGVASNALQYLDLPQTTSTSTPISITTLNSITNTTTTLTTSSSSTTTSTSTQISTTSSTLYNHTSDKRTTVRYAQTTRSYGRISTFRSYNVSATGYNDDMIEPIQPSITAAKRFWIIIIVGSMNIILFIVCIYYIVTKLSTRTKDAVGNAKVVETLKRLTVVDCMTIVLEIFDTVTDYLYATSLIVSNDSFLNMLGWMSLMFSVCGLTVLVAKYSTFRKLIAFQVHRLKLEAARATEDDERDNKMKEIRTRKMDINIISLLNGTIEDIPQLLIVLIATWSHNWNYISILKITCSMISFTSKLCMIVMTSLGCCDPAIDQNYHRVVDDDFE